MIDRVFAGELRLAELQEAVNTLHRNARFCIVERIDDIDFAPQSEPVDVSRWPKGRVFDDAFELRWEWFGQVYRVMLASASPAITISGLEEQELKSRENSPVEYYCWNETNKRLGRTLDYRCVPGQGDVKLAVREYHDDHGRLVFWRYSEMSREGGSQ